MFRWIWRAAALLSGMLLAPAAGAAMLQCVPYARIVSGVSLYGDALTWWDQADGRYKRGSTPRKGAVLAFRPHGPMQLGHVAVVSHVLDERRVLIRHANWSVPGAIEEDVLALDVSPEGDWSQVRVWFSPNGQMGARTNPTFGFIYPDRPKLHDFKADPTLGESVRIARAGSDSWDQAPERAAVRRAVAQPARPAFARTASPMPRPAAKKDEFIVEYAGEPGGERSLGDIIADVKQDIARQRIRG